MTSFLRKVLNKISGEKKTVFPKGNKIKISDSFSMGSYFHSNISSSGEITIQSNVQLREFCSILLYGTASLTIKENVFFNNYCSINCLENIEIGENTLFGEGVKLYDHNHLYQMENSALAVARNDFKTGPIKIGKNCWIGSNVTILRNVEIGDNVIIGANCLIHKSIPNNSIVKSNTILNIQPL